MARKKIVEEENAVKFDKRKLTALVKSWGKNKTEFDKLKKLVDADSKQIKQMMSEAKLDESKAGGYIAKLTIKKSESFDEESLLHYIKSKLWGNKGSMECPYIKRVEVIDWDALEKAMYNGEITKKQMLEMDKFKEIKFTSALNIAYEKEE